MRILLAILLFQVQLGAIAQVDWPVIIVEEGNLGQSFANQIEIAEDKNHEFDEYDVMNGAISEWKSLPQPVSVLDFNTSTWWIRFSVQNTSPFATFYLETARPITNEVVLYDIVDEHIVGIRYNGDDFPFDSKEIKHRKCLFRLDIRSGQTRHYLIKIKSDGEQVTMPFIIRHEQQFLEYDYKEQFFNGLFYGILILVIVIYFVFYRLLKDLSFLYYVMYVIAQILFQASLDGYAFQFLFPDAQYFANHIVIFSAGLAVFFVLLYPKHYLKLKTRNEKLNKIFNISLILIGLITISSAIPGPTYQMSFPIINGFSLLCMILILTAIFRLKWQGYRISKFFIAAFIILISGAVMFILGNFNVIGEPMLAMQALKVAAGLEVIALSISMAEKYRDLQREKEEAQLQVLAQLQEKNKLMDEINVRLEQQVKERTAEIEAQKEELTEKNHEIMDSIRYASRIQYAILPPDDLVQKTLPDSFVLFKPRDIVSGDFYFVSPVTTSTNPPEKLALFAAVDCTGHGVPGAFMSIVGNNFLQEALTRPEVNSTGESLDFLNAGVIRTLRQNIEQEDKVRDGMDLALCAINYERMKLYFSGAKNPIYYIRDGEVNEIKGDKRPIGELYEDEVLNYTTHAVDLKKGDVIYVFTDGYADQFGGEKEKKFTYKRFRDLLISIHQLPMSEQKEILWREFLSWKGDLEQIDDVCIIGVRV